MNEKNLKIDEDNKYHLIHQYFSKFSNDSILHNELEKLVYIKEYMANETILSMGENTNDICLILQGMVRGYYIDEKGNEITKCFSEEMDWCCSYSYFKKGPSEFYIEALENPTILARFHVEKSKKLLEAYPEVSNAMRQLIYHTFTESEKRIYSFSAMEAKERYLSFVKEHPSFVERVKQEYIASYLGITPSSLSRIKRNL